MVTLDQAKEIFPVLFSEFSARLGEQTVFDVLTESELDEGSARAALSGSTSGWDEIENEKDDSNEPEKAEKEDEDDETYGETKRRRSTRTMIKKPRFSPYLDEDVPRKTKTVKKAPVIPTKSLKASKPEKVAIKLAASAVVKHTEDELEETNLVETPREIKETRIPVSQEEALELEICRLEQELMADRAEDESDEEDMETVWTPPPWCVPIRADVRTFDFDALAKSQKELTGRLFDVIVTDPPWQLATSNPTRGVALGYEQLSDQFIRNMPFTKLQDNGFLFMWVINAKYRFALSLFEEWGYELVDEITWIKQTVNRRLAKSHGFYLQHAKETCLVGRKGSDPPGTNRMMAGGDVIFSERRGQSQKPTEIYEAIERLVPGGYFLEIFGRRNNTRDGFVTIGNEL